MNDVARNSWTYLAFLDPNSQMIWVYRRDASGARSFRRYSPRSTQLPAASSLDWYRGWRDFLEFAEIGTRDASPKKDNRVLRPLHLRSSA